MKGIPVAQSCLPRMASTRAKPESPVRGPIFDFVMDRDAGLPKIIDFMNLWASERERLKGFFLLRYEDLRTRPEETLRALLEFMGTPGTDEEIREAVEFSSYENMKKMEQKKTFWLSGGRMVPKDRDNPNTYKVRRAKVGGYRDYFDDKQVAEIDAYVAKNLSPFFAYFTEQQTLVNTAGVQSRASGS
mgnify:CR=1 FL=1